MSPNDVTHEMDRVCLRKANLTEERANQIIDKALIESGLMLFYYKCPFCSSTHLTSSPPGYQKRLRVM